MNKKICIGIFKDSQGEDRIHISADVFGLIELQDIFKSLAQGLDSFNFSDLRLLDKNYRINIVAYSCPINVGLKYTANGTYEWRQTKESWNEFRDKLLEVCLQFPGQHILLESGAADTGDLQVAFSLDVFNHFQE